MTAQSRPAGLDTWLLTGLLVIAGVDGFLLLEPLREAGSRPFFVVFVIYLGFQARRGALSFSRKGVIALCVVAVLGAIGFAWRGAHLAAIGDKSPLTQYVAQGGLFFLGFCPLAIRLRERLDEATLDLALWLAFAINAAVVALDEFCLVAGMHRPLESIFWTPGGRVFPTGLFSEPSYMAGYAAIVLPAALYRRPVWQILLASGIAGAAFFAGDVRSFFPVYAAGLVALALCRWGFNWRFLLGLVLGLIGLVIIALQLKLSSVEDNLSSAYRLGNTLSFAQHAVVSDWVLGSGFGSSHFLYANLDHPAFMVLSQEFWTAVAGDAGFRIPVFNVWVRLFVEIGIPGTLLLLYLLLRALRSARVLPQVKVMLASMMAFGLSTDSYIYGCMTLSMFLAFSVVNVRADAPVPAPRRPRRFAKAGAPDISGTVAS